MSDELERRLRNIEMNHEWLVNAHRTTEHQLAELSLIFQPMLCYRRAIQRIEAIIEAEEYYKALDEIKSLEHHMGVMADTVGLRAMIEAILWNEDEDPLDTEDAI